MKIEYLVALDNGTWITTTYDVPDEFTPKPEISAAEREKMLRDYAETRLATQTQWRRSVYWGIYRYVSEAEDGLD